LHTRAHCSRVDARASVAVAVAAKIFTAFDCTTVASFFFIEGKFLIGEKDKKLRSIILLHLAEPIFNYLEIRWSSLLVCSPHTLQHIYLKAPDPTQPVAHHSKELSTTPHCT
jgi:hypothetical protein